jgi:hypothetical protein
MVWNVPSVGCMLEASLDRGNGHVKAGRSRYAGSTAGTPSMSLPPTSPLISPPDPMNPDAQETAPPAIPTNLRALPSGDEQQKRSQWKSGLDYGADTADGQPSGQGSDKTTLVTVSSPCAG